MKDKHNKKLFTELTSETSATINGGQFPGYFFEWHCYFDPRPDFEFDFKPEGRSYHRHYHYRGRSNGSGVIIDHYSSFNVVIGD
jgi:hypothetical protein